MSEPSEDDYVIDNPKKIQEIIDRFKKSPYYKESPEQRAARLEEYEKQLEPFREQVIRVGIQFESRTRDLNEILSRKDNLKHYPDILPLILQYLPRYADSNWKWRFGSLLATPLAGSDGAHALIKAYLEITNDSTRWQLGSFLEDNPNPSVASDLIQIVVNPGFGIARQRVLVVLAKTNDPGAFDAIASVIDDPELTGHAIEALGIVGDPRGIPLIEPHLSHRMKWVKKAGEKAIRQIQTMSARRSIQ